jgi:hypothetical protein
VTQHSFAVQAPAIEAWWRKRGNMPNLIDRPWSFTVTKQHQHSDRAVPHEWFAWELHTPSTSLLSGAESTDPTLLLMFIVETHNALIEAPGKRVPTGDGQ